MVQFWIITMALKAMTLENIRELEYTPRQRVQRLAVDQIPLSVLHM